MFARLKAWLFGSSQSHPSPTPQERRSLAQQAYEDAVRRGDTRDQSTAWEALKARTCDELAAGLDAEAAWR